MPRHDEAFSDNFNDGFDVGLSVGKAECYDDYLAGLRAGGWKAYMSGRDAGYSSGYKDGYGVGYGEGIDAAKRGGVADGRHAY